MIQKKVGNNLGFLLVILAGSTALKAERECVMSGQATIRSLTGLLHDLTDEEIQDLTESDNRRALKEHLLSCAIVRVQKMFTFLSDAQVPTAYRSTLSKYRVEARLQGVADTTPLCYRVAKGFTLRGHAPKAGHCREDFRYLQNWDFVDEPTQDCLAFWIPRLVPGSTGKTVNEQKIHLAEFRQCLELPPHYCSNFGTASLLSGLILAHYKATGEQVPLNGLWTRTDSCDADGFRLGLGWDPGGLGGDGWRCDDGRYGHIGCFALGVETLGS